MRGLYTQRRLQIIFSVTLMGVMGVSLISPVFPSMIEHFRISDQQIGLIVTAYTFPGVVVSILIGVLADRYTRKGVLVPLLMLFSVAGVAQAAAPTFQTLLALRVLQGIGGAGLVTLSTTLIGDYYDGSERGAAMGLNASVLSIATASYPIIGGLLGTIGWYAPFSLYAIAFPIAVWALFGLSEPTSEESVTIHDYVQQLVAIATAGETIAGSLAAFLAFVLLYGGIITYIPVLVAGRFGSSSAIIGGLLSAMSLCIALISSQTGRLIERYSERTLFTVGFLGYGGGLALIPFAGSPVLLLLPLALFGVGHGLVVPTVQVFMTKLAPAQFRGATMSLYNMALRLGQTVGPLLFGVVYTVGVDRVFLVGGAIGAGAFLLFAGIFRAGIATATTT